MTDLDKLIEASHPVHVINVASDCLNIDNLIKTYKGEGIAYDFKRLVAAAKETMLGYGGGIWRLEAKQGVLPVPYAEQTDRAYRNRAC